MRDTLTLAENTNQEPSPEKKDFPAPETVQVWGLPLARVTSDELIDFVDHLIEQGEPSYFITANLHYAMLSANEPRLADVNRRAALIVADGMPLVWYSRLLRRPLPERVTGADNVYRLAQRAAERGHRVFLLGGMPEVAQAAAQRLTELYPGLNLVGIESPMLDSLSPEQQTDLIERIRQAKPDLLFAALGQPKGELWLAKHIDALGVPACVQIGASLDFVAGRVRRAPRWIQRIGAEWFYRITREPRRMIPRYTTDAVFMIRAMFHDAFRHPAR